MISDLRQSDGLIGLDWSCTEEYPWLTDVCFMKTIAEGNAPRVLEKPGVVSGWVLSFQAKK